MGESCCPREAAGEASGGPELTRRGFLAAAAAALGGLVAAILGATGLSYFISPAFKKEVEDWVDVGKAADVASGAPVKVDFVVRKRDAWAVTEKRSSAWLSKTEDGYTAFDPRCTHLGCPYRWDQENQEFKCPCHEGVFDKAGKVVSGPPPRPLDRYPVKVVAGRLMIQPNPTKGAA